MIAIDGLAEVVLNVHDVPRAVEFYQGLLGLERMTRSGDGLWAFVSAATHVARTARASARRAEGMGFPKRRPGDYTPVLPVCL